MAPANVLVVDDERDLASLVEFNLQQAGFQVRVAHSGAQALARARERRPDLVLLDLMLPDTSGLDVCRSLKAAEETRGVPVVMLTAKGEERDRVQGFEAGVDDYVVKPFSVRELILRVRAVLRRAGGAQAVPEPGALGPLRVGLLSLDTVAHRSFLGEEELPLTVLEFRLLHCLMSRVGRVQSRERLLEDVWGITTEVETRTVDTHVMRLRDKLGPARNHVETVRGVGYRMVDPLAASEAAPLSVTAPVQARDAGLVLGKGA